MDGHELAEARSLAYHRAVASRLRADPSLVEVARGRVDAWLASGGRSVHHARAWSQLLQGPLESLLALLCEQSERARELRQSTPFAGFLDPRERWRIWREVREDGHA